MRDPDKEKRLEVQRQFHAFVDEYERTHTMSSVDDTCALLRSFMVDDMQFFSDELVAKWRPEIEEIRADLDSGYCNLAFTFGALEISHRYPRFAEPGDPILVFVR